MGSTAQQHRIVTGLFASMLAASTPRSRKKSGSPRTGRVGGKRVRRGGTKTRPWLTVSLLAILSILLVTWCIPLVQEEFKPGNWRAFEKVTRSTVYNMEIPNKVEQDIII